MNCYLFGHGQRSTALTLDQTLEVIVNTTLRVKAVRAVHLHNTRMTGEIIHDDNTNRRWNISQKLGWLQAKLPNQPPENKRMLLRQGQFCRAQTTHQPLRIGSLCKKFPRHV